MPEIRQSWQALGSESSSVYSRSPSCSASATAAAAMISHQASPASATTTTTATLEDHQQGHEYKTVS